MCLFVAKTSFAAYENCHFDSDGFCLFASKTGDLTWVKKPEPHGQKYFFGSF